MSAKPSQLPSTGYVAAFLRETEKLPYEGIYHRPATLVIEYIQGEGHALIMGARLYNDHGVYIGWWPSFNIPRAMLSDWSDRIEREELQTRLVFGKKGEGEDALEHL